MTQLKGEDFGPRDRPTAKRIRRLVEMQDFRCAVTGLKLEPEDANLDHIVPIAAGGKHVMGNVQIVHKVINQMKSTLPQDEFLEWCRRVVAHADERARNTR
jgi:5-methylcytosine-specific restriction endonuclease McrA